MNMLEQIEAVVEKDIRPYILQHGGDIRSLSFENGVYRFELLGKCSGCPASDLTSEEIVSSTLKEALPEVKQVVLVQSISEDLLAMARSILNREAV